MSGVGRGAILRRMLDNSPQLPNDNKHPPIQPFNATGFSASIGRGTSLMTPSQFMKSTSSGSGKHLICLFNYKFPFS